MTWAVGVRDGKGFRRVSRDCVDRGHRSFSVTRFAPTWIANSSWVSRRQPTTIPVARSSR